MSATEREELLSRLAEDSGFRDELRSDPVGALSSRGVELSDDQRDELRNLDTSGSDEVLAERVSKAYNWSDRRLKHRVRAI